MKKPCAVHRWSSWSSEILECPDGAIEVVELRQRYCKRCGVMDEREEVLACGSS